MSDIYKDETILDKNAQDTNERCYCCDYKNNYIIVLQDKIKFKNKMLADKIFNKIKNGTLKYYLDEFDEEMYAENEKEIKNDIVEILNND